MLDDHPEGHPHGLSSGVASCERWHRVYHTAYELIGLLVREARRPGSYRIWGIRRAAVTALSGPPKTGPRDLLRGSTSVGCPPAVREAAGCNDAANLLLPHCQNLKCVGRSPVVDPVCIRNRVLSEQRLGK